MTIFIQHSTQKQKSTTIKSPAHPTFYHSFEKPTGTTPPSLILSAYCKQKRHLLARTTLKPFVIKEKIFAMKIQREQFLTFRSMRVNMKLSAFRSSAITFYTKWLEI